MRVISAGFASALSLSCALDHGGPASATAPRSACEPSASAPKFPLSPGGAPEASIELLRAHACELRIIDVRTREEIEATGLIEGAEAIPQGRLSLEAQAWSRDEPIVVVCRSGRRSSAAAEELRQLGFSSVASLTGGMLAWQAAGLPTVAPADEEPTPKPTPVMRQSVSREDIVAHVAGGERVRWTKAADLLMRGTEACVDGRDVHGIVGTPGGDAGELVLALAVAEQMSGRRFSRPEVEALFDAYLAAFGHFYLHSDEHVATELAEQLRPAAETDGEQLLRDPPVELRAALRARLVEPAHVGCGHLRLMLENPERYGVRRQLVADVIGTFFDRLWADTPALEFVVLRGRHDESAVVTVELAHDVQPFTRIPLVSPRLADTEVFVVHPQVAHFMRQQHAAFLLESLPQLAATQVDEAELLRRMETLANRQSGETLSRLAPNLPHFQVHFSGVDFDVTGPRHQETDHD